MKNNTYIVTLESGHYEWTREDEIHSLKEAKEAGIKEAGRCGKDIFYLVPCYQWWPSVTLWTRNLLEEIEEESDCILCDKQDGVYFDDEIIYKVVNGKAVKLGKSI